MNTSKPEDSLALVPNAKVNLHEIAAFVKAWVYHRDKCKVHNLERSLLLKNSQMVVAPAEVLPDSQMFPLLSVMLIFLHRHTVTMFLLGAYGNHGWPEVVELYASTRSSKRFNSNEVQRFRRLAIFRSLIKGIQVLHSQWADFWQNYGLEVVDSSDHWARSINWDLFETLLRLLESRKPVDQLFYHDIMPITTPTLVNATLNEPDQLRELCAEATRLVRTKWTRLGSSRGELVHAAAKLIEDFPAHTKHGSRTGLKRILDLFLKRTRSRPTIGTQFGKVPLLLPFGQSMTLDLDAIVHKSRSGDPTILGNMVNWLKNRFLPTAAPFANAGLPDGISEEHEAKAKWEAKGPSRGWDDNLFNWFAAYELSHFQRSSNQLIHKEAFRSILTEVLTETSILSKIEFTRNASTFWIQPALMDRVSRVAANRLAAKSASLWESRLWWAEASHSQRPLIEAAKQIGWAIPEERSSHHSIWLDFDERLARLMVLAECIANEHAKLSSLPLVYKYGPSYLGSPSSRSIPFKQVLSVSAAAQVASIQEILYGQDNWCGLDDAFRSHCRRAVTVFRAFSTFVKGRDWVLDGRTVKAWTTGADCLPLVNQVLHQLVKPDTFLKPQTFHGKKLPDFITFSEVGSEHDLPVLPISSANSNLLADIDIGQSSESEPTGGASAESMFSGLAPYHARAANLLINLLNAPHWRLAAAFQMMDALQTKCPLEHAYLFAAFCPHNANTIHGHCPAGFKTPSFDLSMDLQDKYINQINLYFIDNIRVEQLSQTCNSVQFQTLAIKSPWSVPCFSARRGNIDTHDFLQLIDGLRLE